MRRLRNNQRIWLGRVILASSLAGIAIGALIASNQSPTGYEQELSTDDLLREFRGEFIQISPGEGDFPQDVSLEETASTTLEDSMARTIKLDTSFAIGKYEVTQSLWESVMGRNPSRWTGPRNSVEMLSFDEAVDFCRKVTTLMREAELIEPDQMIRLPSEVEWEYVCRAGTNTAYSFGKVESDLDEYAWHTGNAAGNDPPVGAKKPNPWGLYDIHGYLWEWCLSDTAKPDSIISPNTETWFENASDEKAALRGGSWKDAAPKLTSGFRRIESRDLRDDAVGLRCVLVTIEASNARGADQFEPTRQDEFVPPNSELELLWNDGDFTEGPAAAPDGSIYFSDIGNRTMRFDPKTGDVEVFREPSGRTNGLVFDSQGRLVACEGANVGGGRRISRTDVDGNATTVADSFDGKRFNSPNDLVIDAQGNIYFTDPRYVGDEPRELDFEVVMRIATDGTVTVAADDVTKPNGILISPDGTTAYVAENNPAKDKLLLAYDIQPDGSFSSRRTMFDFGEGRGIDGMAMDQHGNLYATAGRDELSGVYIFSPTGDHLALIRLPGDPTNCCFGIKDEASTLYITAPGPAPEDDDGERRYALYRIKVAKSGLVR